MTMKSSFSAYFLLTIGIVLIVEPFLPQYHFSPLWFSLGVLSVVISEI